MRMGDKIRECRKEAGYTQEELGKLLKPTVNRAAVNKWECGYVENIKRTYIEQMAELFHILPAELMCFDAKPGFPKSAVFFSEEEEYVLTSYRRLTDEDKIQLNTIVSSFMVKEQYRTNDIGSTAD